MQLVQFVMEEERLGKMVKPELDMEIGQPSSSCSGHHLEEKLKYH